MSKQEKTPIDMLLDDKNTENIVLYDDKNRPVEFEQIAIIPIEEKIYAILHPVKGMEEEMPEDEALVFCIEEVEDEDILMLEEDMKIIDQVFDKYYELLKADGVEIED